MFDCCQSVPGRPVDVQQLGADWIVGAGHKMCGPTGSAFLWGRCVLPLSCHLFQCYGSCLHGPYVCGLTGSA